MQQSRLKSPKGITGRSQEIDLQPFSWVMLTRVSKHAWGRSTLRAPALDRVGEYVSEIRRSLEREKLVGMVAVCKDSPDLVFRCQDHLYGGVPPNTRHS